MALGTVSGGAFFGLGNIFIGSFSAFEMPLAVFDCARAKNVEAKARESWQLKKKEDACWLQSIASVRLVRTICSVMAWASCRAGAVIAKSSYLFFFVVKGLSGMTASMQACKALIDLCNYAKRAKSGLIIKKRIDARKNMIKYGMQFAGNFFLATLAALELAGLVFNLVLSPWISVPLIVGAFAVSIASTYVPDLIYSK